MICENKIKTKQACLVVRYLCAYTFGPHTHTSTHSTAPAYESVVCSCCDWIRHGLVI